MLATGIVLFGTLRQLLRRWSERQASRQIRVESEIRANPERVFAVITDPRKPFLTSNPIVQLEIGSVQSRGVGTIYRWTFRLPFGATFRFAEVVTGWEEGRRIAYEAISGWEMRASVDLAHSAVGTHQTFTLEHRLPWPWNVVIPGWLETLGVRRALANVKRRSESGDIAGSETATSPEQVLDFAVKIAAPPQEVFRVVGDPRSKLLWVPAIKRVEMLTDGPPSAGTRYLASSAFGPIEFAFREEIVAWEPPSRLVYQGVSPWGRFYARWLIQPRAGGSRVHYRMDYWFPGGWPGTVAGRLLATVVGRWIGKRAGRRLRLAVEENQWPTAPEERAEARS